MIHPSKIKMLQSMGGLAKAKTKVDKRQDKKIAKLSKMLSTTKGLYSAGASAANATSQWAFYNITRNIAQGDDVGNRKGNQIDVLKVKGHIDLIVNVSTGVTNMPRLRAVLVSTKNDQVDPTFEDIFDINSIYAVRSQSNMLNKFSSVYSDKIITATDALDVANHTNVTIRRLKFSKTFKNGHKVSWTTNGVNAASTGPGQIYLFVVAEDNYNATTYPVTFTANWNVLFTS